MRRYVLDVLRPPAFHRSRRLAVLPVQYHAAVKVARADLRKSPPAYICRYVCLPVYRTPPADQCTVRFQGAGVFPPISSARNVPSVGAPLITS